MGSNQFLSCVFFNRTKTNLSEEKETGLKTQKYYTEHGMKLQYTQNLPPKNRILKYSNKYLKRANLSTTAASLMTIKEKTGKVKLDTERATLQLWKKPV